MLLVKSHPCPRARRSILCTVKRWRALRHQRLALAKLEPEALRDMGISATEARKEASRPFWDAPNHWMR